jgi:hypothetical protein
MTVVLVIVGAAALLAGAVVHLAQLVSIFHAVPWIGPLFAADAIASTAIAVTLVATRHRLVAAAGVLVSGGALAGLAASSTIGLLGWQETTLRPSVVIAIAAELVAVATLLPLAVPAPRWRGARVWRAAAGAGLVAIAVLHVAAAGDEWADARGVFWSFMALAGACGVVAVRLARGLDRSAPAIVLGLAVLPIAGYVLSRTTGLPGATDDVGDWANPLGLAALAVEVGLVAVVPQLAPARRSYPGPRSKKAGAPRRARSSSRARSVAAASTEPSAARTTP